MPCQAARSPGSNLHPRLTKSNAWECMESHAKLPGFEANRPRLC
ncbi:hypothetical protein BDA96_10G064000 [Sorghum bicolor]|uniref:Uncharacterized protein n=1 Tax=Sorghum bicolor TaxID=4558 RepID=A0A921U044_SORBI|nr:hypothetical protein BDA96_10G064000 [Sorghum bicolor]